MLTFFYKWIVRSRLQFLIFSPCLLVIIKIGKMVHYQLFNVISSHLH